MQTAIAKTLIQMRKMAEAGAKKMGDYTIRLFDNLEGTSVRIYHASYFRVNEDGNRVLTSYAVTLTDRHYDRCQCAFYGKNHEAFGAKTTCKHIEKCYQYEEDLAAEAQAAIWAEMDAARAEAAEWRDEVDTLGDLNDPWA